MRNDCIYFIGRAMTDDEIVTIAQNEGFAFEDDDQKYNWCDLIRKYLDLQKERDADICTKLAGEYYEGTDAQECAEAIRGQT